MINMNSRAATYLMPLAAAGLGAAAGLVHHPDEGERDATGFGLGLVATSVGLTALVSIPKSSATRFNLMFNPLGSAIPAFAALGAYYLVNEALERGAS